MFDTLTAKNELFLKILLYLTEHLNHYNEYFQKDNPFYNQVWNKIQEGYVLFGELVLKLEKQNPKFQDYYCIYLDLLDQDPSKEVLTIP